MSQSQPENMQAVAILEATEDITSATYLAPAHNGNQKSNEGEVQAAEKQAGKRKKRVTSDAWQHFKRLPLTQTKGKHRAQCNYYGRDFASHPTDCGTTQLLRHLEKCPKNPNKASNSQSLLSISSNKSLIHHLFSQERCRKAIAKFLIKDELPFRIVEGEGFKELLQEVEPRFQMPSRWTIARDCYKIYLEEAKCLRKYFKRSKVRVSLTTDCWTSIQNSNYMCLTAHWVDENWSLQKRILNFCVIENHKGETIGKKIEDCLFKWGIDKVFTITVDNASSNDSAIAHLKKCLRGWNGLVCDGEYLQMRCATHILNLIVSEGLKEINRSIELIRHAVKYVRSSPARETKFKDLAEKVRVESKSLLSLDCPTRWNSTYLMLDSAVKFMKVFTRMEEEDQDYIDYFKKKVKLDSNSNRFDDGIFDHDDDIIDTTTGNTVEPPSAYDWTVAKEFLVFLKLFYTMTLKFSGSNFVTTNTCFQHIVAIQTHLNSCAAGSHSLLGDLARRMQTKYDKYWGKAEKMNPLLVVAVILDPRFKMTYVKIAFENIFPEHTKREFMLKRIMDVLYRLYDHYSPNVINTNEASGSQPTMEQGDVNGTNVSFQEVEIELPLSSFDATFQKFLATAESTCNVEKISEVDEYLQAELVGFRDAKFDVLGWWRVNGCKYKILNLLARDLLAIPVSTVSSESAFSTGGRILDSFRSSLSSKMVEALICAQNWLFKTPPKFKDLDIDNFDESASVVTEEDLASGATALSSSESEDDGEN